MLLRWHMAVYYLFDNKTSIRVTDKDSWVIILLRITYELAVYSGKITRRPCYYVVTYPRGVVSSRVL